MKTTKTKNRQAGFFTSVTEIVAMAFVLVCFSIAIGMTVYHEKVNMHEAYSAWVKQTENPKNLSYDEWRALIRAGKSDTQVLIVPIH